MNFTHHNPQKYKEIFWPKYLLLVSAFVLSFLYFINYKSLIAFTIQTILSINPTKNAISVIIHMGVACLFLSMTFKGYNRHELSDTLKNYGIKALSISFGCVWGWIAA